MCKRADAQDGSACGNASMQKAIARFLEKNEFETQILKKCHRQPLSACLNKNGFNSIILLTSVILLNREILLFILREDFYYGYLEQSGYACFLSGA